MDHITRLTETVTPPLSPTAAPSPTEYISGIAAMYRHGLIDRDTLMKAILRFRLPHARMASELGLSSTKELFTEFIDPTLVEGNTEPELAWEPWSFEDARLALFDPRKPAEIAPLIGRTGKAVTMFRYRMLTQGCRVSRAVYELIMEGYTPEQISELGHSLWLAQFAATVHALQLYGALHYHKRPIKIIFT